MATTALALTVFFLRDADNQAEVVEEAGGGDPFGATVSRAAAAVTAVLTIAYGASAVIGYHDVHACRAKR